MKVTLTSETRMHIGNTGGEGEGGRDDPLLYSWLHMHRHEAWSLIPKPLLSPPRVDLEPDGCPFRQKSTCLKKVHLVSNSPGGDIHLIPIDFHKVYLIRSSPFISVSFTCCSAPMDAVWHITRGLSLSNGFSSHMATSPFRLYERNLFWHVLLRLTSSRL